MPDADTPPEILPQTEYTHPVRVRYAECDPFRVAHHSSYIIWMEEARTEILRPTGITYADLESRGIFLVITKLEVKYRRPVRYDDLLEIRAKVEPAGAIRIRHRYEIALVERMGGAPDPSDPATPIDGVCAIATTELACVGADGRPKPLPGWLAGRA
ncbi:MAG: thioesterase family protein [Planctomycetota bacterium]